MELTVARRGTFKTMNYLSTSTVEMLWEIPLSELIMDYFDQLKSRTKGYASLDYDFDEYKTSKLVKLDILLSGKPIDALSFIVHADKAYDRGRVLTEKLKEIIPRQMFEVPIQAAVGSRVLSRQTGSRICEKTSWLNAMAATFLERGSFLKNKRREKSAEEYWIVEVLKKHLWQFSRLMNSSHVV